jgi:hypothetical protein
MKALGAFLVPGALVGKHWYIDIHLTQKYLKECGKEIISQLLKRLILFCMSDMFTLSVFLSILSNF